MRINLKREFFTDREFLLAEHGSMRAVAFRYSTGVEALRIESAKGYFIILPFKGQQIWRAHFCGRDLHMRTMMEEPQRSDVYLETYGAFLLHCGLDAIGSPTCYEDKHAQHGRLPSAQYQSAYIECGEGYMEVGGRYDYDKSFVTNYSFSPSCRLYENDSVLHLHTEVRNRRREPMEYAYLCHLNFRPVDGAELVYSADYDVKSVKVLRDPRDSAELRSFKDMIEGDVTRHHRVGSAGEVYDPEICFTIRYKGDGQGRAYTLQADGEGACYVSHPVDALPVGVRWISRTGNEDSMGMVLPATAEALGYSYIKRTGQMKVLPPLGVLCFDVEAGYIEGYRVREVRERIESIKNN
jgi:hypothetical protein